MEAESHSDGSEQRLAEALKRFSRSIELCDDYLRGYYGLKQVTDQILGVSLSTKERPDASFELPERKVVETLNEVATAKLAEIVRRSTANEKSWRGYSSSEIAAARALLEKTTSLTKN
jgi:hypothetical protein